MAKYRVRGPDGAVHVFEGPDNAAPADIEAAAAQQFGQASATSAAAAAPEQRGMLENIAAGLASGVADLGDTIINAGTKLAPARPDGMLFDRLPSKDQALSQNADRNASLEQFNTDHDDSTAFKVGRVGGNIAATLPVGGVLGGVIKGVSAAPVVQAIGNAVASGGLRTGATMGPAANLATRAAGGAISGGAGTALVDPEHAGTGAALGATLPLGVAAAGKIGNAATGVYRGVSAAAEPLRASGRSAIAGRTLNAAAGDDAAQVAARIGEAGAPAVGPFRPGLERSIVGELVPGSIPTTAQVAENGGLAALERSVSNTNPAVISSFTQRAQEQAAARTQALRNIAQDDTAKAAAVAARKAVSDPLYEQATRATYTVTPALEQLLQTPAMKQALVRAETLAANNQRPFTFNVAGTDHFAGLANQRSTASRQITGQGLQDLKMAVDQMLVDPASGYAGASGNAVKALRGKLINYMETANPAFKTARTTYADMSRPVNQMEVGARLYDTMKPALSDFGGLGREQGNAYATALRNADQTAVKATKFKGAGMEDVMTPEQMSSLGAIARDLARKANVQDLGKGAGSDTAQKIALSNIAAQSGAPRIVGGVLGTNGVSKISKMIYGGPEEKIRSLLAQALLDPALAADLMGRGAGAAGASAGVTAAGQAPRISAAQSQMIADLFARAAPVAITGR